MYASIDKIKAGNNNIATEWSFRQISHEIIKVTNRLFVLLLKNFIRLVIQNEKRANDIEYISWCPKKIMIKGLEKIMRAKINLVEWFL